MRKAIVHEVTGEAGEDGIQRCVMCGKGLAGQLTNEIVSIGSGAQVGHLFPSGHVTEVRTHVTIGDEMQVHSDYVAGDDVGEGLPHVPCTKLTPA